MNAKELMNTEICTADAEASISEASVLMGERRIGSVLILDRDNLVGILTERDVVRALSMAHDAPGRPVAEWMSRNPTTASPDTDVRDALATMVEGGFRHLPIVEGSRVIGMISMRDIARKLTQ